MLLVASARGMAVASRLAFIAAMRSAAVLPPSMLAIDDSPPGAAWTSVELRSWMPWNSVRWMTRWPAAMTPGAETTGAAAGAGVGSL